MPLSLLYITSRPEIARIADKTGVDRLFVDMESLGKETRQAGMNSVKSHHTVEDARRLKPVLTHAQLLVRINPLHAAGGGYVSSQDEIAAVLDAGADLIMLPMYRTMGEVETFLRLVDGRAKTVFLAETPEACALMKHLTAIKEVDEIHLGLNDLHLALRKTFMFELLADGTVDHLCAILRQSGKPFGFGGIARIGYGMLPAEYIIREHYRLGSTRAILSRSFCNADSYDDIDAIDRLFCEEMRRIRDEEETAAQLSDAAYLENHRRVQVLVRQITERMNRS